MENFGSPTKIPSENEEDVIQSVVNTFTHSELIHLKDIFDGVPRAIGRYYDDTPSNAGQKQEIARELVQKYTEPVENLLYKLDNSTVKKNEFEKNLVSRGISEEVMEVIEPTTRQLMVFAYHLLYNKENFRSKLRLLLLNSRLFKETTERTYVYDWEHFNMDEFEYKIQQYVRHRNKNLYRPFTIRHHESEDTIYLDFYKETARVMTNIFQQRLEGSERTDSELPTVAHESTYKIKTLLCRVDTSLDDEIKFVFKTDPKNGWKTEIKKFFKFVAGIEDPFDEDNQVIDSGASETHKTAIETVQESEGLSVKKVEEAVTETMQNLTESQDELPDISEGNLKWVGWTIDDDKDTMTDIDDFTAKTDLHNYFENTPGVNQKLFHILTEANKENIGLRFRSDFGDGKNETFVIRSKFWSEESQVDEKARNVLNTIFKGDTDDD